MIGKQMTNNMLIDLLNKQPAMRSRIVGFLELVSNSSGDFCTADGAEEQLIKELHHFGHEIISAWALNAEQASKEDLRLSAGGVTKHGKKKSTGTQSTVGST